MPDFLQSLFKTLIIIGQAGGVSVGVPQRGQEGKTEPDIGREREIYLKKLSHAVVEVCQAQT